jgi:hypothetical protein
MMRRRGGLVRTVGRTAVVAGTASAVAGGVSRRQTNKYNEQQTETAANQQSAYDQGLADADAAAAPPAAPPAQDSMIDQLTELGKLRDQGILTDAEFDAQKAKVLAG